MTVLGFAGYAGSGKDTAARVICPQSNIVEMSQHLKAAMLLLDPIIPWDSGNGKVFYYRLRGVVATVGWDKAKQNPEVRRLLQVFGTEAGRDLHGADCWLNLVERELQRLRRDGVTLACLTGIRFPNEALLPDKLVWVERPGVGAGAHKSEQMEVLKEIANVRLLNDCDSAGAWRAKVQAWFSEFER